eukprot:g13182.t1
MLWRLSLNAPSEVDPAGRLAASHSNSSSTSSVSLSTSEETSSPALADVVDPQNPPLVRTESCESEDEIAASLGRFVDDALGKLTGNARVGAGVVPFGISGARDETVLRSYGKDMRKRVHELKRDVLAAGATSSCEGGGIPMRDGRLRWQRGRDHAVRNLWENKLGAAPTVQVDRRIAAASKAKAKAKANAAEAERANDSMPSAPERSRAFSWGPPDQLDNLAPSTGLGYVGLSLLGAMGGPVAREILLSVIVGPEEVFCGRGFYLRMSRQGAPQVFANAQMLYMTRVAAVWAWRQTGTLDAPIGLIFARPPKPGSSPPPPPASQRSRRGGGSTTEHRSGTSESWGAPGAPGAFYRYRQEVSETESLAHVLGLHQAHALLVGHEFGAEHRWLYENFLDRLVNDRRESSSIHVFAEMRRLVEGESPGQGPARAFKESLQTQAFNALTDVAEQALENVEDPMNKVRAGTFEERPRFRTPYLRYPAATAFLGPAAGQTMPSSQDEFSTATILQFVDRQHRGDLVRVQEALKAIVAAGAGVETWWGSAVPEAVQSKSNTFQFASLCRGEKAVLLWALALRFRATVLLGRNYENSGASRSVLTPSAITELFGGTRNGDSFGKHYPRVAAALTHLRKETRDFFGFLPTTDEEVV